MKLHSREGQATCFHLQPALVLSYFCSKTSVCYQHCFREFSNEISWSYTHCNSTIVMLFQNNEHTYSGNPSAAGYSKWLTTEVDSIQVLNYTENSTYAFKRLFLLSSICLYNKYSFNLLFRNIAYFQIAAFHNFVYFCLFPYIYVLKDTYLYYIRTFSTHFYMYHLNYYLWLLTVITEILLVVLGFDRLLKPDKY